MISNIPTSMFVRAIAFGGTAVFSLAIMNSLPLVRQQRQRAFAEATMDGNLSRVRWLHFAGARVNARGDCCMPLFLAAGQGDIKVVRYLLDEGADINAREKLGHTALAEAAYYGRVDVVKELLLRGADVNAVTDDGTALDIAVARKNAETADLLKHRGGKTVSEIRTGS
ncbi:MAG TPA: ankyrin repeat domain-containing protein [Pyrinomonadaceae bacterium]|nr:ankyrin repeat domain-containing protein [Pyrinomonadaceae bacterium]